MGNILDKFEAGIERGRLRHVTILWKTKTTILAWAMIDDHYEAHVWTNKPFRKQGWGAQALGYMVKYLPPKRRQSIVMCMTSAEPILAIGKYLYHWRLLRR